MVVSVEAHTLALEWWHRDYSPTPPEAFYYGWINYQLAAQKYLEQQRSPGYREPVIIDRG